MVFKVFDGQDIPMMEMTTASFQMLLYTNCHKGYEAWNAPGQPRTGHKQHTQQLCPGRCFSCFDLPCGWVLEDNAHHWPHKKIQQLLMTFEHSQLSNHTSFCCSQVQEGGRDLTSESSMAAYRQESTQLCWDAPELTAGPQDGKDGVGRLLGSMH